MGGTGFAGMEGARPDVRVGSGNPEALKYGKMWAHDEYRKVSPGEQLAQLFLAEARPKAGSDVIDFGCGTGRGALMLALLGGLRVTMIDFVRNSLDPEIQDMLTTQAHLLRFLKHDLEVPLQFGAPYGFCCDLMEHIPPDRVDRVLDNILKASEHVFFSISTVPDSCGDLIGETLHLTVQPYTWWLAQFSRRECIVHWSKEVDGAALFYVTAWSSSKEVMDAGQLNVTEQLIRTNVRTNLQGRWHDVVPRETNDSEVMILGGGPSLNAFEDEIRARHVDGTKIITLNGAYNWAHERGIWPVNQVMVDAREFNERFVQPIDERCLYFLSSQVHPAVFEGLPPERTYIWHTSAELIRDILLDHYGTEHWRVRLPDGQWWLSDERVPRIFWSQDSAREAAPPAGAEIVGLGRPDAAPWFAVPGGSTALLRAIPLMRMLGFRKFHLYGCDSSFSGEAHHAFAQPENEGGLVVNVTVAGGRVFRCAPWMVSQAHEFMDLIRWLGDEIELEIHGDGLLAHILETGARLHDELLDERLA